jgi:hypothetical protein
MAISDRLATRIFVMANDVLRCLEEGGRMISVKMLRCNRE